MILTLAWRNIWRNKRRSLITMAMVFLAVFLSIIMRSLQIGTYDQMIDGLVRYSTGYIQISAAGYQKEPILDNSFHSDSLDITKLRDRSDLLSVAPRISGFALGAFQEQTQGVSIVGFKPSVERESLELENKLRKGEIIQDGSEQIMLGSGLAEKLKMNIGDSLTLLGQGYHAQTAAGLYRVAGILKFANPKLDENTAFLSLNTAQYFFGAQDRLTSVAINIHPNEDLKKSSSTVEKLVNTERFEVNTWIDLMPELYQGIQGDEAGGLVIIFILYMLIGFGIFGTILMMTAERQYEFGVLISIGMKRLKLSGMLLLETLMMTVLAALVAIAASTPLIFYLYYNPIQFGGKAAASMKDMGFEPAMYTSLDFSIATEQTSIVAVISLVLSIYSLVKLFFLKPVEAMKT